MKLLYGGHLLMIIVLAVSKTCDVGRPSVSEPQDDEQIAQLGGQCVGLIGLIKNG